MDSDDEEMRDASTSSVDDADDAAGYGGEAEQEGMMVMEVRWFEVDLDYEFDAPRWFDLARPEEAPAEAAAAETWFATAPSYPPSPLIAMMLAEDLGLPNLRSIAVADVDAAHCSKSLQGCSGAANQSIYQSHVPNEGRVPCYGISKNETKPAARRMAKGNFSKGSTLMKPTASQLARQNRQIEAKNVMPGKKSIGARSERSTVTSNGCTYQAGKRQRLEKGHLNKAVPTSQHELIHKAHEKNVMNSSSDRATGLPKLKITVPREPELATKQRADRSRILRAVPTNSKQLYKRDLQSASTTQAASTRKVVQPFRAHQHANVQHANVPPNVPTCAPNRAINLHNVDKKSEDSRDETFKFKAQRLDKKLSLTAEAHRAMDRQAVERPNYITTKDCKESMIGAIRC